MTARHNGTNGAVDEEPANSARTKLRRRSAWKLTVAAGVVAFAAAAVLLLVTAPNTASAGPAPNLAVVSPGLRAAPAGPRRLRLVPSKSPDTAQNPGAAPAA